MHHFLKNTMSYKINKLKVIDISFDYFEFLDIFFSFFLKFSYFVVLANTPPTPPAPIPIPLPSPSPSTSSSFNERASRVAQLEKTLSDDIIQQLER